MIFINAIGKEGEAKELKGYSTNRIDTTLADKVATSYMRSSEPLNSSFDCSRE